MPARFSATYLDTVVRNLVLRGIMVTMKVVKKTFLSVANKTLNTIDRRLLPFVWMGVIFYLSSIPDLRLQGELASFDFVLRKLGHVSVFAILMIFWKLNIKNTLIAVGLTLAYAIIDELHQAVVPGRNGTAIDVLIDCIGILVGLWVYRVIVGWKEEHERIA